MSARLLLIFASLPRRAASRTSIDPQFEAMPYPARQADRLERKRSKGESFRELCRHPTQTRASAAGAGKQPFPRTWRAGRIRSESAARPVRRNSSDDGR
jgi:hypothetical protein